MMSQIFHFNSSCVKKSWLSFSPYFFLIELRNEDKVILTLFTFDANSTLKKFEINKCFLIERNFKTDVVNDLYKMFRKSQNQGR